jgi:Tol biopolymer transport system component
MVAFVYNPGGGGTRIGIEDVAGDTLETSELPGSQPAWSPDGSSIAYIAGSGVLTLVAPDGSGARALTPAGRPYNPDDMVSWSGDGKYLLARAAAGTYDLIDVQTGAIAPLTFASAYVSLSLR